MFAGPKSSFNTIFELIIATIRQIKLQIFYHGFCRKIKIKKMSFELRMAEIIKYYGLLNSIVTNWRLLFTSKFLSFLYYFLGIKQKLLIAFYPQTNSQIKRQNTIIEAYLQAFDNFN